jgi:hypothetical protein
MGRPLRHLPRPGCVVEVTCRVMQGRFLLRPSPELNELVLGVLGRAQELYQVDVFAYVFTSNHFHLLLGPPDELALARFMCFLNGNLAKEVGRLHGWREKLRGRRYRSVPLLDEEVEVARLKYLLAHGVKEALVRSPGEWPGASCLASLLTGKPAVGYWFDRTAEERARRRGEHPGRYDHATKYEVILAPLPGWQGLSEGQRRDLVAEVVRQIEEEGQAQHGGQVLGREAVLAQDPHGSPASFHPSPAPAAHASTDAARQWWRATYRAFAEVYRAAADLLRQGILDVAFPEGCFPPARPYVPAAAPS